MLETYYQKTKITESSLRPNAILRLKVFATMCFLLTPVFTALHFTQLLLGLGEGFEWIVTIAFMGSLLVICFSRLANMLIFTDKRLDEWEIRLKKEQRLSAFAALYSA